MGIGQVVNGKALAAGAGAPGDGAAVSSFERGEREPNLVIVDYAKLVGMMIDPIADDAWDMKLFEWG